MNENRLREQSPSAVLKAPAFLDIGGLGGARYRDLLFFDLGEYEGAKIEKASLSLNWYYPAGVSRLENTIVEVYRPAFPWNPDYVSWNTMDKEVPWKNPGGDWIDKIGIPQGNTPFASFEIRGMDLPDNRYYELDITELVRGYAEGKYENTGLLLKAKQEDSNYIAFYSAKAGGEDKKPMLKITIAEDQAEASLMIQCKSLDEAKILAEDLRAHIGSREIEIYSKV